MLKSFTRKIALLIAIIMAVSFVVTSCASKTPATSPAADLTKSYQIGVNTWGSGVPVLDKFGDNAEYVIKMLGLTSLRASDDFTPDKESANVQNFCSAGVNGIDLQAAGVTNLIQMAETCKSAKVPFVINTFIGNEADRDKITADNTYYVGSIANDLYADGKMVADMAIEDGFKTACIIGGNIGDTTQDLRQSGFTDEFTAKGGTVLDVARCTDPSQAPVKAEDMLSAHKDVQVLYAMVGDFIPGSLSAAEKLGLKGKITVYMSGVDTTSAVFIKDGTVKAGCDGLFLASLIAPTLLLNYLDGHPIKDASGKAPALLNAEFKVDSSNIDAYMSIFCTEGVQPLTDDMLKNLCWRFNPNVTYQTYVDLCNGGMALNVLLKAHNLPEVQ